MHHMEKVEGHKVRERSPSFKDHFSQATMFWHSITEPERDRLVSAIHFELGKVKSREVRHRMIHEIFNRIDHDLAVRFALGVGIEPPTENRARPVDQRAPEVSVEHQSRRTVKTLKTHGDALHFVDEMFKHCKTIGATGEAVELLEMGRLHGANLASGDEVASSLGVVTVRGTDASIADRVTDAVSSGGGHGLGSFTDAFIEAFSRHRHWDREMKEKVPA